ncbi:nickel-dependent lactate racemase [Methanococcoides seepicolus]|uniref:Nickel-dependent lactate racemase n=1 Tax=Methanococcoides seepicolus TaxID=2828780 RepID=A0A9E4ZGE4_9EURY|nr:nickel-dependent lactate racemase [Methanococcoides seepicolus]MCM1987591.1 nickel-dependent lactate racemase [Methanococcoides seepicolus]
MNVKIPYGKDFVDLDVTIPHEVLSPNEPEVGDESSIILEALSDPVEKEPFEEFANNADKILVIVNDATRPTPTARVLEEVQDTLRSHPDVKFIVATGAHRGPTEDEFRFIFGNLYDEFKDSIYVHDARKDEDMEYLGVSSNGTEMYINKMVREAVNILVIGSVEPHYFAGYTGGRKAFLPGVAGFKTIEMNHKHALSNKAQSLALEGNPVAEDMTDAMAVLNDLNIFSIQTILTADHGLYAMAAGDLFKSFDAAVEKANEVFCTSATKKGNIVLTAAPYPMDIDLYQSQKALENGRLALEDGGIIIMVSKCRDGVGEDTFLNLLSSSATCEDVMEKTSQCYKLGFHKAARMAQIGTMAKMWAVSDLDDEILLRAKLEPQESIQKAFDKAVATIKAEGKEPYAIILPQGSLTIPLIE